MGRKSRTKRQRTRKVRRGRGQSGGITLNKTLTITGQGPIGVNWLNSLTIESFKQEYRTKYGFKLSEKEAREQHTEHKRLLPPNINPTNVTSDGLFETTFIAAFEFKPGECEEILVTSINKEQGLNVYLAQEKIKDSPRPLHITVEIKKKPARAPQPAPAQAELSEEEKRLYDRLFLEMSNLGYYNDAGRINVNRQDTYLKSKLKDKKSIDKFNEYITSMAAPSV